VSEQYFVDAEIKKSRTSCFFIIQNVHTCAASFFLRDREHKLYCQQNYSIHAWMETVFFSSLQQLTAERGDFIALLWDNTHCGWEAAAHERE
jgi:hypothetical protein